MKCEGCGQTCEKRYRTDDDVSLCSDCYIALLTEESAKYAEALAREAITAAIDAAGEAPLDYAHYPGIIAEAKARLAKEATDAEG